jgi:PTS system fructose-specific IIC component
MKVSELMNPKGVLLYAKIDNSADALGILVELQEGIGVITNGNAYYNAVSYRETFGGTTAIGGGIALPHACNAGVSAPGISALLLRRGVDWGAPDGKPVDLVFMIAVPPGSESLHLQILARLVNLMSRSDLVESLRTASNPHRFVELIAKTENACFASWGFLFASAGAHSICARAACGNCRGRIWDPPYGASIWTFVNITKKCSESHDALYVFALALNR